MFTANSGQWPCEVRYAVIHSTESAAFSSNGVFLHKGAGKIPGAPRISELLSEIATTTEDYLACSFVKPSKNIKIESQERMECVSNFYQGNDSLRWRKEVPNYGKILYENVWPNIDMEYTEGDGTLAQRFLIHPGGRIEDINLRIKGGNDDRHDLKIADAWYEDEEGRHPVSATLKRSMDGVTSISAILPGSARIAILSTEYCSYFRMTESETTFDAVNDVLVDQDNNVILVGTKMDNVLYYHNYYESSRSSKNSDIIVSKIQCGERTPAYITYIGGSWFEGFIYGSLGLTGFMTPYDRYMNYNHSACVSHSGSIYVVGLTTSNDFPVTVRAIQTRKLISYSYPQPDTLNSNGFVFQLNKSGQLLHSTYLGGPGPSGIGGLTLDHQGNVYLSGIIGFDSLWFISPWAVQPVISNKVVATEGIIAAFLAKLNSVCDSIIYASYYFAPQGIAKTIGIQTLVVNVATPPLIAVDANGNLICAGWSSQGLVGTYWELPIPVTSGMRSGLASNKYDGFITKFNQDASAYVFSTWFGGSGNDFLTSIAVDANDNILLAGTTESLDYPLKNTAIDIQPRSGRCHGYLTRLSPTGNLVSSTFLSDDTTDGEGKNWTGSRSIAIDECGNIAVLGFTKSKILPLKNPIDMEYPNSVYSRTNILSVLDASCSNLLVSSYLNDSNGEFRKLSFGNGSYVHLSGWDAGAGVNGRPPANAYNAYQPSLLGLNHTTFARIHLPSCEPLSCTLSAVDTIRVTNKRKLVTPAVYTITLDLINDGRNGPTTITEGQLVLPQGLYLSPPTQSITVPAMTIGNGERRTLSWSVRYDSSLSINPLDNIAVAYLYQTQSNPSACPSPGNVCRFHIVVLVGEDEEPNLACTLTTVDTLGVLPDESGYSGNPLTIDYSLRNTDVKDVLIDHIQLVLPKGMGVDASSMGDTLRPCGLLVSGQRQSFSFPVRIASRAHPRTVTFTVLAFDRYGFEVSRCEKIITIPAKTKVSCDLATPESITYYPELPDRS